MGFMVSDVEFTKTWTEFLQNLNDRGLNTLKTVISDDLFFMHPDIQAIPPTIEVDSDCYVELEAYQPMEAIHTELDAIRGFVKDMKHHYDLMLFYH